MKRKSQTFQGIARLFYLTLRCAAALGVLIVLLETSAVAQEQGQCSNATLKGAYGLIVSGTRSIGGVKENFVAVARRSFDGNGNFVTESASAHGVSTGTQTSTAPPPGKYSGTYQVNADCTGTAVLFSPVPDKVPNIKTSFVIVDGGKEVREIVMSPSDGVVTANFRRM